MFIFSVSPSSFPFKREEKRERQSLFALGRGETDKRYFARALEGSRYIYTAVEGETTLTARWDFREKYLWVKERWGPVWTEEREAPLLERSRAKARYIWTELKHEEECRRAALYICVLILSLSLCCVRLSVWGTCVSVCGCRLAW